MSRRKHQHRITTPPTPPVHPSPPAPDKDAAQPAPEEIVYQDSLPIRHRHAGGVDRGVRTHWAAAPPLPDGTPQVQEFDTFTDRLEELADGLVQHGVTTVAREATGVSWEPLFAILEGRGIHVILVAPSYTSGIKGRPKTDRLDCQWIQRLHAHGLRPASFRPSADMAVLRHYLRQRAELVRNAARHIQHLQKALEQRNRKLPEVLNDLTGVTGQKILTAILAGARDPLALAQLRNQPCQSSTDPIARALHGSWRPEAWFALQQGWDSWQHYQSQLRALEEVIRQQLHRLKKSGELPALPRKIRVRGRPPNDPRFDVRAAWYDVTGVDLTEREGIAEVTALVVVSEIGLDRSRFPSVKHFCAWLGLCPVVKQSGRTPKGKKKIQSAQARRGRGRAAQALCLAAKSLWKNQSALGSFWRRLQARLGAPKAVLATAHKLARQVYQTLTSGVLPAQVPAAVYEAAQHARAVEAVTRKARRLGLVVLESTAEAATAPS